MRIFLRLLSGIKNFSVCFEELLTNLNWSEALFRNLFEFKNPIGIFFH